MHAIIIIIQLLSRMPEFKPLLVILILLFFALNTSSTRSSGHDQDLTMLLHNHTSEDNATENSV